jgi:hypothetical protein
MRQHGLYARINIEEIERAGSGVLQNAEVIPHGKRR